MFWDGLGDEWSFAGDERCWRVELGGSMALSGLDMCQSAGRTAAMDWRAGSERYVRADNDQGARDVEPGRPIVVAVSVDEQPPATMAVNVLGMLATATKSQICCNHEATIKISNSTPT